MSTLQKTIAHTEGEVDEGDFVRRSVELSTPQLCSETYSTVSRAELLKVVCCGNGQKFLTYFRTVCVVLVFRVDDDCPRRGRRRGLCVALRRVVHRFHRDLRAHSHHLDEEEGVT